MRRIVTLLSCLMSLPLCSQVTIYNINRSISCTDTIHPFATNAKSYGLSIDGEGRLLSDTAFIRVVLVDNKEKIVVCFFLLLMEKKSLSLQ